jgi:hypothetical protein
MGRLTTFVFGGVIGAVLVFGALKYHLVKAGDGYHLVPKTESSLEDAYVDIRSFGPEQWSQHQELMSALVKADKTNLIGETAVQRMGQNVQQAWDGLIGTRD